MRCVWLWMGIVLCAQVFSARAFTDITVPDGKNNKYFGGGAGLPAPNEDQEVENNAVANQGWDYEAFVLDGNGDLGIIAGFDMKSGLVSGVQYQAPQGDIFIRLGRPVDADSTPAYDFVVHFPAVPSDKPFADTSYWGVGENVVAYQVYAASGLSLIWTGNNGVEGGAALFSNYLWQVNPNGATPLVSDGLADYANDLNDQAILALTDRQYHGGNHDVLSGIDLDWLLGNPDLLNGATEIHFYTTMGCGNDMLRGKMAVPDGGMTLLLLGASLTSLAVARRRVA